MSKESLSTHVYGYTQSGSYQGGAFLVQILQFRYLSGGAWLSLEGSLLLEIMAPKDPNNYCIGMCYGMDLLNKLMT